MFWEEWGKWRPCGALRTGLLPLSARQWVSEAAAGHTCRGVWVCEWGRVAAAGPGRLEAQRKGLATCRAGLGAPCRLQRPSPAPGPARAPLQARAPPGGGRVSGPARRPGRPAQGRLHLSSLQIFRRADKNGEFPGGPPAE